MKTGEHRAPQQPSVSYIASRERDRAPAEQPSPPQRARARASCAARAGGHPPAARASLSRLSSRRTGGPCLLTAAPAAPAGSARAGGNAHDRARCDGCAAAPPPAARVRAGGRRRPRARGRAICYDGLRASCVDRPLCLGARLGAGSGWQGPTIGKTGRTCPAGVSDTASRWLARESRARVGACGHRHRATYVPVWCGVGGRGARTHRRVAPAGRRNRQRRRLARSACLCELPRLLLPEPELRPGVHTPCNASACELDLTYASGKVADSALCSRVHPRRSMAVVLRRQAEPPS